MSEILQAFLNARISYRNSNRVRSIMQKNLALIMRNNNLARLVQARIAEALLAIVINPVETQVNTIPASISRKKLLQIIINYDKKIRSNGYGSKTDNYIMYNRTFRRVQKTGYLKKEKCKSRTFVTSLKRKKM